MGKTIELYNSVNQIADSIHCKPTEEETPWAPKNLNRPKVTNLLRKEYPLSNSKLSKGSADINFTKDNIYVLATHPRPYNQWIYDSLKSDIVVVSNPTEKSEAKDILYKEKSLAQKKER